MRRLSSLVLVLGLVALARAVPIPMCPLEGPNVFFTDGLQSWAATNCQPRHADDVEYATCVTRYPDDVIPVFGSECFCRKSFDDLAPALIPGTYAIASSGPCPPGVAAILTSLVGHRHWGADAGCDDAGDLCADSVVGAMLDAAFTPFHDAPAHREVCHVFRSGHRKCKPTTLTR